MAISKIGQNLWQIKISVRVPGKDYPVTKQEQFTGTKVDAQLRESELIQHIKTIQASSLKLQQLCIKNFEDLLSVYQENLRVTGKLSTSHNKKIEFIKRELGHIQLSDFVSYFDEFIRVFRNATTTHGTTRSEASTNRIITIVRAAFNFGIDAEYVDKNPITKAKFPKGEEKARDRYLTSDEQARLLKAIREHRPYLLPFIRYNLAIPCRKSELIKAKKEQYNPFTNTIYIPDSKADIPINKPVPPEMRDYFRNIPSDCPYLFYRQTKQGKFYPLGDLRKAWAYCLEKAEITDAHIHDLRHVSATELYSNGIPEREIMDIAGWKTPMLSTYRHKNSLITAQKLNRYFEQAGNCIPLQAASH
jgi:integrase